MILLPSQCLLWQCLTKLPKDLDKMCSSICMRWGDTIEVLGQETGHPSFPFHFHSTRSRCEQSGRRISAAVSAVILLRCEPEVWLGP